MGVLGSTRGTDLEAIIKAIDSKQLYATVSVVISNVENAFILDRARTHNIKAVYLPSKGKTREQFDSEAINILDSHQVDLVLLIGFMRILSLKFIDRYYYRLINVHPSLLPEFAGGMDVNVHQAVLDAKKKKSGCTIHFIDDGPVDGGPILVQKAVDIDAGETAETLKAKVQQKEGEAFIEALMFYDANGLLRRIMQEGYPLKRQTLYRLYRKPLLSSSQKKQLIHRANKALMNTSDASHAHITDIASEYCFYIEFENGISLQSLSNNERRVLNWLLSETFEPHLLSPNSFLHADANHAHSIIEVGPRILHNRSISLIL